MAFGMADVFELSSRARDYFVSAPVHARLDGAHRDLTTEELRVVAMYEAVLSLLNRKGALTNAEAHGAILVVK